MIPHMGLEATFVSEGEWTVSAGEGLFPGMYAYVSL